MSISKRHIASELHELLREYPVVSVIGPRQAGKTTLVQSELRDYAYCNLEQPRQRRLATDDPEAFLAQFPGKVILDEIQRAPELLSDIQVIVDDERTNGRFVLTGSHQLALQAAITQSLAGRTALLTLFPFSIAELPGTVDTDDWTVLAHTGFLPRIFDQNQRPTRAWSNYFRTYVERDVRLLINLKDDTSFERFIRLLAGRAGQLMDYASLGGDVGVDAKTIRNWLSILEASFIIYKLPPYFENFGKRVIKAPKYYFTDTGLLCFLLGIETPAQLARDPLVGQIFENLVLMECLKVQANAGHAPRLYFYRDSNGNEINILIPQGRRLIAVEVKSARTYKQSLLKNLVRFEELAPNIAASFLVYSGQRFAFSNGITALNFREVPQMFTG